MSRQHYIRSASGILSKTGVLLLCLLSYKGIAQEDKKEVRAGNSNYEKGQYSNAELEYRKALEKNATSYAGTYNLGSSLYRQEKQEEAIKQYTAAVERAANPGQKSDAYHNLGNAFVKAEKYAEAVSAYKNALKLDPADSDTRYNLAYAQAKLKQQQEQQNKEGNNKDKNQDKDQQKQDQDQQKQDQNKEQEQAKEEEQNNQQPKPGDNKQQPRPKISKEDAERILQALKNNEQDLNKKLSKKEGVRINVEKNW
jgi:tetratricopeptide (TPR) repeat protein